MTDELVFRVQGRTATPAEEISLADAGLRERDHLQEWVLANPEILGPDVLIITSEFDRWMSRSGREADRLDILGLGADGRLVVVELKRDRAPDYVTTQAINYAARASRFSPDDLADVYLSFVHQGEAAPSTAEEALAALTSHAPDLSPKTLRNPRITLVAGEFPAAVTSAAVWLTEQGIDMVLVQVRAYDWAGDHAITVSRLWPVADVEDYVVAPARHDKAPGTAAPPVTPWTADDLERLIDLGVSETVLTTMDMCARAPEQWVGGLQVMATTGRPVQRHRGDYGGFSIVVRRRFDRANPPFDTWYGTEDGEPPQSYYRLSSIRAEQWRSLRGLDADVAGPEADAVPPAILDAGS